MPDPLPLIATALALLAPFTLSGCDSKPGSVAPLPNVAAVVPSTAPPPLAMAAQASGVVLKGVAPGGTPGDGPAPHGAETSPGPNAGPGSGSTAIGGQSGGQATGGGSGGSTAPTSGDGKTK